MVPPSQYGSLPLPAWQTVFTGVLALERVSMHNRAFGEMGVRPGRTRSPPVV